MGGRAYSKPPITEAVIAFHFSTPLGERERERFRAKINKAFPREDELRTIQVTTGPQIAVEQSVNGHKLSSEDGLLVTMLLPEQLSTVRLAPYADWDKLLVSARQNWNSLVTISGRPNVKALSTRYINRIDLPLKAKDAPIDIEQYFNLSIRYPQKAVAPALVNFSLNAVVQSTDHQFQHTIIFGFALPALVDHVSLLLDIDTSTITPMPSRHDDLWPVMEQLHEAKNRCFEACITDKTRELFE